MEALRVGEEVRDAIRDRRPVVALESTIVAHGLSRPQNLEVARQVELDVRESGAVPATVAVLAGQVVVGLSSEELELVAGGEGVAKVGVRDLGPAVAAGGHGATTVASTARVARHVGIGVMATGGLGGVHRDAARSFDESSDLVTLAETGIVVVCSGVKSVLDVPATLERLETLNVTVLGYRTSRFPAFYLTDSGQDIDWRVDSPGEVRDVVRARTSLGAHDSAVVVANPLPVEDALSPQEHDEALRAGLSAADRDGIHGKAVTPFLLDWMHRETGGRSLAANRMIIRRNARLAAEIAVALAHGPG